MATSPIRMVKNFIIAGLKRALWRLPTEFLEKQLAKSILTKEFAALSTSRLIVRREDVCHI